MDTLSGRVERNGEHDRNVGSPANPNMTTGQHLMKFKINKSGMNFDLAGDPDTKSNGSITKKNPIMAASKPVNEFA